MTDSELERAYSWAILYVVRKTPGLTEQEIEAEISAGAGLLSRPCIAKLPELPLLATQDETVATLYLEALRWPNGTPCTFCGDARATARELDESFDMANALARNPWSWYCRSCSNRFHVREGTALHHSGTHLFKYVRAMFIAATCADGIPRRLFAQAVGLQEQGQAPRMLERFSNAGPHDPLLGFLRGRLKIVDGRKRDFAADHRLSGAPLLKLA